MSREPRKNKALSGPMAFDIRAVAGQFARAGTEGLENPAVFQIPEVVGTGGLAALKAMGKPSEVLMETKERIFEA